MTRDAIEQHVTPLGLVLLRKELIPTSFDAIAALKRSDT